MSKYIQKIGLAILVISMLGSLGISSTQAGLPDPAHNYMVPPSSDVFLFSVPDGSGTELGTANQITVRLLDSNGDPVVNWPKDKLGMAALTFDPHHSCFSNSLTLNDWTMIADSNTDSNGYTTFSGALFAGGRLGEGVNDGFIIQADLGNFWIMDIFGQNGASAVITNIIHNSADINGDGVINLSDANLFSADLSGGYNFRSDFNNDGVVNLSDTSQFMSSMGASCP